MKQINSYTQFEGINMTSISEILYEDAIRYLESLDHEEIIELAQEHRTTKRLLEAEKRQLPVAMEE